MPLVVAGLQAELIGIYEKGPTGNPTPLLVGLDTAKAYMNFCSAGMNAGGHPFIAMPGAAALGQELGDIYSSTSPSGALTAQKMAKAFDSCLATWISLFQNTIVTAPGLPGLISGLVDIFSKPNPSSTIFANKLAKELNTNTLAAKVMAVTPYTPVVPFTGPIS